MATTPNYVLLQKITLSQTAASVTFSNLASLTGYTDLKVVASARIVGHATGTNVWANTAIKINGTAVGTSKTLYGTGSAVGTESNTGQIYGVDNDLATANTFGNLEFYIPNFSSSNYKSISVDGVLENNATQVLTSMSSLLYSSTSAVGSITLYLTQSGETGFAAYSTFSIYGIAAVGTTPTKAPYALGGDVIETDGTYWYHAFLSSGTFTPNKALSCDVLVVAGGGGADNGGGGAGGVLAFSSQPLSANTALTATVGAGGASAGGRTNGGNSSFGSITPVSVGGGYGGSTAGNTGGSGGGSWSSSGSTAGAAGTSGQGNSGGASGSGGGGGGGGAGGNGASATGSAQGGAGGAGVNTVTNWGSLSTALSTLGLGVSGYIAGGGGGYGVSTNSSGGSGGGGTGSAGGAALAASAAIPNTGSGGGNGSSGTGGSGLIIVRYAI
jgi:hypothetical protein